LDTSAMLNGGNADIASGGQMFFRSLSLISGGYITGTGVATWDKTALLFQLNQSRAGTISNTRFPMDLGWTNQ